MLLASGMATRRVRRSEGARDLHIAVARMTRQGATNVPLRMPSDVQRSGVRTEDGPRSSAQDSALHSPSSVLLGYLGLFSSVGTLLCCALPSLLVLAGLGATVASVLASAPWLVALSRHKAWVFAASAILIVGNFY